MRDVINIRSHVPLLAGNLYALLSQGRKRSCHRLGCWSVQREVQRSTISLSFRGATRRRSAEFGFVWFGLVLFGFVLVGFVLFGFVLVGFVLFGFVLFGFVLVGFVLFGFV